MLKATDIAYLQYMDHICLETVCHDYESFIANHYLSLQLAKQSSMCQQHKVHSEFIEYRSARSLASQS